MSWDNLLKEKEWVQVTYIKANKVYCDVFAMRVDNCWYTKDADGGIVPFDYKVIAWQYPCGPYSSLQEYEDNRFEINVWYFENFIKKEELDEGNDVRYFLDCNYDDEVYIIKPSMEKHIEVLNELYLYKNSGCVLTTDTKTPLKNEDVGSLFVMICEMGTLKDCEYIQIKSYDKAVQEITDRLNGYKDILGK